MKYLFIALFALMSLSAYAAPPEGKGKPEHAGKGKPEWAGKGGKGQSEGKGKGSKGKPVKTLLCHYGTEPVLDDEGLPVIDLETGLELEIVVTSIINVPEHAAEKHIEKHGDVRLETGDEVVDAIAMENCLANLAVEDDDEEEEEDEEPVEVIEISLDPVDSLLSN